MTGEPWAPTLSDVAQRVPTRTRDVLTPGSDKLLMTFNANTTPTDADVQQQIDNLVATLEAQIGDIPDVLTLHPDAAVAMREWVGWRVAADIELAYPNRDADVRVADQLAARADKAWAALQAAMSVGELSPALGTEPVWAFPLPPPWGDKSPGSGTDYVTGPLVI